MNPGVVMPFPTCFAPPRLPWRAVHFALAMIALACLTSSPLTASELPRVYVGVYLHDVSTFDQKNGVFDVDADVWAKWRGDFDPDRIGIANGGRVEMKAISLQSDGTWHSAKWRLRGTLRGEFPLHRFPFDEQTIAVVLELPEDEGQLVPDLAGSGMEDSFSVTDWHYEPEFHPAVSSDIFRSDLGNLAFEGREATVNRVGFEVVLKRPIRPVILKLFLPLAIVALIVLASLFVHPESTQPRVTMSVTGLVAAFAFQFSVSDVLPEVAYITLADALFIIVYTISVVCVVAAVLAQQLHQRGHITAAFHSDRILRFVLPTVIIIAVWSAIPDPYPPIVIESDPIPEMARVDSAHDVVRIGTTQRLRVASSPPGVASTWPLIYNDPDAGLQVLGVEQGPRVDSEALRFLAGGELEVTWTIRDGAKWSDGTPITVDDLLLPLVASPDPYIVEQRTEDRRTLILRWSERLSRALESPDLWPTHHLEETFHAEGYEAVRQHLGEVAIPTIGPYHILSHDDDRIIAEANPHFLGAAPNIERIELIRYDDSETLTDAFMADEIDITAPNAADGEYIELIRQKRPEAVHQSPSSNFLFLQTDPDHPLLSQLEVRRAIVRALDRQRLADEAFGEGSRVAHIPLAGQPPEGVKIWEQDRDAAQAILEEAEASRFTIPLTYPASTPESLINGLVEDLEAVGLRLELNEVRSAWGPWRAGDHGGLLLHTLRGEQDAAPRRWWNLPLVDGRYPPDARHAAYTDEVHTLVEREMRALYPERSAQLQDALFAAWSQRLPSIPLVFSEESLLADPALQSWQRPPDTPFGHGLEKWYFVESQ